MGRIVYMLFYERAVADESTATFVLYDRATEQPIGTTYLADIDAPRPHG